MESLSSSNVGVRNAEFVLKFLNTEKVPVVAKDLLDSYPRKVYYFPKSGRVLVKKLQSLPNVTIHTNAQTTEITGADGKVNGLKFKDRATGVEQLVELEGVFVQIGLVPNTEFLRGTVELSKFGEIVIDAKGHTSVPGVFAAGDCTTVPYKQIVIAAGAGATAALSAFDHLIRA